MDVLKGIYGLLMMGCSLIALLFLLSLIAAAFGVGC